MKALNLNDIERPSWPITLRDEEQTVVNVLTPEVDLVERLIAMAPKLDKVSKTKDGKLIKAVFELLAELLNVNEDGLTFTPEELRDRYKIRMIDVFKIVAGYLEFVKEIQDAKN